MELSGLPRDVLNIIGYQYYSVTIDVEYNNIDSKTKEYF